MKNLFYFLFFISFYVNSAEKKEKTLKIQTSDEFIIEAPEKYFLTSCVVQELLKDCSDEDNPIPLFNISYKGWLEVERFLHAISILEDKNSLNTARIKANNEFLQLNSQEKIYSILCIANYLQIPVLLEKCMQAWGEKNYSSTDNFFLPRELSLAIAQYMPRFKALKDATAFWIVSEFNNKKEMLCVDNYEPHLNSVWCVDFSKCGKYLAAGHGRGAISCIDLEKNDGISLPSGHPRVSCIEFDKNSQKIWASGDDGKITLWDYTGSNLSLLKTYNLGSSKGFAFSCLFKKKLLIADAQNGGLCFFSLDKKHKKEDIVEGHSKEILVLRTTADESLCVTGSYDKSIIVWDIKGREHLIKFNTTEYPMSSCFNSLKQNLWCGLGDGNLVMYDLQTESKVVYKKEHTAGIWATVFGDDYETLLCTGARDSIMKLWDIRTKNSILSCREHQKDIQYIAVHKQKGLLATACHDETIKIWDIRKISEPLYKLRKELDNNLTIEQVQLIEQAEKIGLLPNFNKKDNNQFNLFSPDTKNFLMSQLRDLSVNKN